MALGALARREHSRRELEHKLTARGVEPAAIRAALDALGAQGLQDDRRFAASYARQRAERGYGPRRIARELRERGVDADAVGSALAEHDFTAHARAAWRKKFRRPPANLAERARHVRFLEYRGFAAEHIRHALGQATDDEDF